LIIFIKDRQEFDFPAIQNPAILSNCGEDGTLWYWYLILERALEIFQSMDYSQGNSAFVERPYPLWKL